MADSAAAIVKPVLINIVNIILYCVQHVRFIHSCGCSWTTVCSAQLSAVSPLLQACLNTFRSNTPKASSTFKFDKALISLWRIARCFASLSPLSLLMSLSFVRSHLLAISSVWTSGRASCSIFCIHLGMFRNDLSSVTSYTSIIP